MTFGRTWADRSAGRHPAGSNLGTARGSNVWMIDVQLWRTASFLCVGDDASAENSVEKS